MRWSARLAVFAVLVASACGPSRRAVRVEVSTPSGAGVAGATVAWVCEPTGDAGAVTGDDGAADIDLFNSDPERCVVTVAKPGYHTRQVDVEALSEPVGVELTEVAP